jgi:TonB-linked SusC/RagA family outer membrane protein
MYKIYTNVRCRLWGCAEQFLRIIIAALYGINEIDKRKWIMRINILFLLITLCLVQVSATTLAQKITLKEKDATLISVFEKISKQSGVEFLTTEELLIHAKAVSIDVKNEELGAVLQKIFDGQPLSYSINDKVIAISKKDPTFLDRVVATLVNIDIRGMVLDEQGNPLVGAVVKVRETTQAASTNEKGEFYIPDVDEKSTIIVAFVGYEPKELKPKKNMGAIRMVIANNALEEVKITVSTGYQTLSKERATGSFTQVDNELINRSVGTNVLQRLDGVTSGIIFGKVANRANTTLSSIGGDPGISIRGRSTMFSNTEPLLVLDNFPYDGDYNNINPNDVESITILKDAAAASIWGVRAANGVIVITTKKGSKNQVPTVSFKSDLTITGKPDLYKVPQLSSKEFIELEKYYFDNGYYDISLNYLPFNFQTPAIDILDNEKKGVISHEMAASKLDALGNIDARNDYKRYFLRNPINQQYALSIKGGGIHNQYYISGGYDKNLYSLVSDSYNRFNLTTNNTFYFLDDRLTINSRFLFSKNKSRSNPLPFNIDSQLYPYMQLVDRNGQGLPVSRDYRQKYKDDLSNIGLLDWNYNPFNERNNDNNRSSLTDNQLSLQVNYKVLPKLLDIDLNYQFQQGTTTRNNISGLSTYNTRLQINQFSQTATDGTMNYPVPLGAIAQISDDKYKSNAGRLQLNYHQIFGNNHEITALAGTEIKDYNSFASFRQLYGYNEETATDYPVNFGSYPQRIGYSNGQLSYVNNQMGITDRFFSYYGNASYTYNKKYIFSTTARRDESNLFGVEANQKGVPLYSLGLSWNINKEKFYRSSFLPYLRLRLTDGYNGNLNKSLSAFTTAQNAGINTLFNTPQLRIINPPNPALIWERVHVRNAGLDFGFKNNIISGSIDFYTKKGTDLIAASPVAPQTGVAQFTGNTGSLLTKGMDVSINTINLKGRISWNTNLLFNYVKDKVTEYRMDRAPNSNYVSIGYFNPYVGKPYSALFAFPWAGLDNKGNPQGYLEGKVSTDYASILNSTSDQDLEYIGSAVPTLFGSLRNNIEFKGVQFSFNISYKFGYFIRRSSFNGEIRYQQADYDHRWKKNGDEKSTDIPSLIYPMDFQRSEFYNGSEVLVERGDHIRLQDIQLSYTFSNKITQQAVKNLKVYVYINNLGIIWRANKLGLDPDYVGGGSYRTPDPRSFAIGLSGNF